ncbi:MAG: ATP-binding cassette domain-containing protein [bacterium]|nr:ATP-binding cassette domain-containing protein [Myxococcales bacterium]
MRLLALIDAPSRILAVSAAGGLLAALVVTVVNEASAIGLRPTGWGRAALLVLVLGGMYLARRAAARLVVERFEQTTAALRQRFAAALRTAPLRAAEQQGDQLAGRTGDLAFVSNTLVAWVSAVQHVAFGVGLTVALAFISGRALLQWSAVMGVLVAWMWPRIREIRREVEQLGAHSAALGREVEQLVDGFVQAKLDGRVAGALADDIGRAAASVYAQQVGTQHVSARTYTGAIALLFLGSGLAAFAPASTIGFDPVEAYELVILYELSWAPLIGVLIALPQLVRAEAAAARILDGLDALPAEPASATRAAEPPSFDTLALSGVEFAYPASDGAPGFLVGPLDLVIRRGELVVVTGGNGSGKTTMLKLLLGLYPPQRGALAIDGRPLLPSELAGWRARFSFIGPRQPLFDRLYGLAPAPEEVERLLRRFGIAEQITCRDGVFGDLALSTGQRMRLAMVIALLEDRPVCVFDEWTANQDPETSGWYYDTFLPERLAAGKTVVAVSHDARFFDRADHLVRLDGGRITVDHREAVTDRGDRSPG